jgi:four helix bundle protein
VKFKTLEDLEVYKAAREFRKKIYKVIDRLPVKEKYSLADQMRRAAISLTNNIAEGYGRYHYKENMQFCRQSRGSLFELIDDLNICVDEEYLPSDAVGELKAEAGHVHKLLNGYISYLKRRKEEGVIQSETFDQEGPE